MSSGRTKNILIFGATGLIGTHITSAILAAAPTHDWSIAIFTSPSTAASKSQLLADLAARGAEILTGDITSAADIRSAYARNGGIDTVVSCLGRPVIDKQNLLIELADQTSSVRRFLPSEYGTDIEYDVTSKDEKPHQMKLGVRATIRQCKDLEHTFVVTGPYGDADAGLYLSASGKRAQEAGVFDVANRRAVVIGDGKRRISLTTMRDVGKLVVAALLHLDETKNRAIKVNSFTTTPLELVKEFERQTRGQPWDVSFTSLERLKELEKEAWEQSNPVAGGFTLRRIWAEGRTLYQERDNVLVGMEGEGKGLDGLESCVRQAIEVQSGSVAKV